MKKLMKRFLPVMLAVCLCAVLSVTAYARYIYDIRAYNSLDINGDTATMYSEMDCDDEITQVNITQVLQKKSGSSYSTVPGTSRSKTFYNNSMPSFESNVACTSAGTYRVKTTYKVTGPQGTETHTKTSAAVTR